MISVVYFAKRGSLVKIGTTGDIKSRIAALNGVGGLVEGMRSEPVELVATMPGSYEVEQSIHETFAPLRYVPHRPRVHGEWFLYEEPLIGFIQAVAAANDGLLAHRERAFPVKIPGLLTLSEAISTGILPWSKEAAKKRLARSDHPPAPVDRRGRQTLLYRRGDLVEWARRETAHT